jgi:hypothetical protein
LWDSEKMKLALCKKVEHLRFVLIPHDSSNAESTGRAAEAGDFVHLLLSNHEVAELQDRIINEIKCANVVSSAVAVVWMRRK